VEEGMMNVVVMLEMARKKSAATKYRTLTPQRYLILFIADP
jgi:hypothetical protein